MECGANSGRFNQAIGNGAAFGRKYQTMYQEQEDMKASGVLLQTMARALEWMDNIFVNRVFTPPALDPGRSQETCGMFLPRRLACSRAFDHGVHGYTSSNSCISSPYRCRLHDKSTAGFGSLELSHIKEENPGTEFSLAILSFPEPEDFRAAQQLFPEFD